MNSTRNLGSGGILLLLLMIFSGSWTAAQGPDPVKSTAAPTAGVGRSASTSVVGKWTYRSFISDPNLGTEANDLLFGSGTMELSVGEGDSLKGTLGGTGWQLTLTGKVINGTPVSIRFTGSGTIGGEEWVYDYLGYVVPAWPNGVDQRPAIVGTIVRTKAHSNGAAKAGVVAQWIAVAQQLPPANAKSPAGGAADANRERTLMQPTNLLRRPRRELPSERILRQRYLQEDPLPQQQPRLDSLPFDFTKRTDSVARSTQLRVVPVEVKSADGRLDVTLDVEYGTATIGNDQVHLRMYNHQLIGPTLRVKAGDVMYITLNNRLPVEPSTSHDVNGHHGWNTTNLHFHGLHVAPQGPVGVPNAESDNVLIALPPSNPFDPTVSQKNYQVKIPPNHVAGTFWYHAHKHGSTTAQVSSGMAGALIVERADAVHNLDSVVEVAAAKEEIMLLQEIPYLKDPPATSGEIERSPPTSPDPDENDVRMFSPGSFRDLRRYVTVNGDKIPTIRLAPGEIRRLRLIYSGQRERIRLRVERAPGSTTGLQFVSLHEIAVDGLPTGSIREINPAQSEPRNRVLEMFPGYRSDVLLKAPSDVGDYYLVDTQNDTAVPRPDTGADGSPELLRWVAKIRVEGTPVSMALPTKTSLAPHRLTDLSATAVTGTQHVFYGLELALSPIGYFISRADLTASASPVSMANAEPYNPLNPRVLPFGATERWFVGSRNNGAAVIHPFHIHTNPFLITKVTSLVEPSAPGVPQDVTSREIGTALWRDTLAMKHGYTYELLSRYDDYSGDFVDHCHILDHEDNGMMELVRIASPTPGPPKAAAPPSVSVNRVSREIPSAKGKPSVLFFVQGSACPHCMAQLTEMGSKLADGKVPVAVVTASTESDLKNFPAVPFVLVADPELKLFKQYGAYDGEAKHATIVRDGAGREVLRKVGDAPFVDSAAVAGALGRTATTFAIAVRGTDKVEDDYITWAPTACTIRMVSGAAGTDPVTVTLTNNDSTANPDAGELRFATSLLPKSTATQTSITLEIKPDGTPVDFFVAGVKPSTLTPTSVLNGGRDTKIVIHQGTETGARLGEHAMMVRVRKALRHPDDPRPKLSEFELSQVLKAIRDLHLIDNRFEWYVRMHRLATGHGTFAPDFGDPPSPAWPDLAHQGPAFITWHRAFLLQFERELQTRYPYVALPYWVQGTSQTMFAGDKLGAPASSGEVVDFAPGSALYGWSISLNMDRGSTSTPMGLLRRRPLDHNDPAAPPSPYRQWPDLAALPNVGLFALTRRRIEVNPHNIGHGTVGPDGIWMSNCRESNADPVFYLFHCNHDYLWAKFQYEEDRFLNDGSDPAHYSPPDAFADTAADRTIPFGHHLKDTMWPWDGTMGDGTLGDTSNRPNVNDFGAFPTSTVPFLWPAAPAHPKPADMIDYLGMLSRSNDMGYCYDDVPFGPRPQPPGLIASASAARQQDLQRVAIAVISNRAATPDTRLIALKSISPGSGTMTAEFDQTLARVVAHEAEAPDIRSAALQRWFAEKPADAFNAALPLITDTKAPLKVRMTAVEEAGRQIHFSEIPHSHSHSVLGQLRKVVQEESPAPLKAAAVRQLAPSADPLAKKELLSALEPKGSSSLQLHETVALLRFFPDEKARIREFISSANDDAAVAAIQALYKDPESIDERRRLVRDNQRSSEVRKAAIQSLIHEDLGDLTDFLIDISADEAMELDLRTESLAAASVRLRKGVKAMPAADKQKWTDRLKAVRAAETTDLGRIRLDALAIVSQEK